MSHLEICCTLAKANLPHAATSCTSKPSPAHCQCAGICALECTCWNNFGPGLLSPRRDGHTSTHASTPPHVFIGTRIAEYQPTTTTARAHHHATGSRYCSSSILCAFCSAHNQDVFTTALVLGAAATATGAVKGCAKHSEHLIGPSSSHPS
jgi:hypothetical protein